MQAHGPVLKSMHVLWHGWMNMMPCCAKRKDSAVSSRGSNAGFSRCPMEPVFLEIHATAAAQLSSVQLCATGLN